MTIIAAYYYNEGKRVREIRLDEHVELNENRSGFCWIALKSPPQTNSARSRRRITSILWRSTTPCTRCARPSSRSTTMSCTSSPRPPSWSATGSATARWRSSPVTITLSPCGTAMPERWANFGSNSRHRRRSSARVSTMCCTRSCTEWSTSICPSSK